MPIFPILVNTSSNTESNYQHNDNYNGRIKAKFADIFSNSLQFLLEMSGLNVVNLPSASSYLSNAEILPTQEESPTTRTTIFSTPDKTLIR
jgi:hypothetical protein